MAAPKVRRVLLTLEVDTDAPLPVLDDAVRYWLTVDDGGDTGGFDCRVLQASANVIRPAKRAKGGRRGKV